MKHEEPNHRIDNRFTPGVLLLALQVVGFAACSASQTGTGTSPAATHADAGTDADAGSQRSDGGIDVSGYGVPADIGRNPRSGSQFVEEALKLQLTPEEKIIADLCPRRQWSKNVPTRTCTKDTECGDGFCDRGQCSPIFSCAQDLGSRCEMDGQCPYMLCIEGRCRSCASDEECQVRMEHPNRKCMPPGRRAPGRECTISVDRKTSCIQDYYMPYCQDAGPPK